MFTKPKSALETTTSSHTFTSILFSKVVCLRSLQREMSSSVHSSVSTSLAPISMPNAAKSSSLCLESSGKLTQVDSGWNGYRNTEIHGRDYITTFIQVKMKTATPNLPQGWVWTIIDSATTHERFSVWKSFMVSLAVQNHLWYRQECCAMSI